MQEQPKKKKMGRPSLGFSNQMNIRFTEEEMKMIDSLAKKKEISKSDLFRILIRKELASDESDKSFMG